MSKDIKQEDLIEKKDVTPTSEETQTEQDPLKEELEKVQRTGKTEAEKAAFSLRKNADRAKELGIDPAEVLGYKSIKQDTTEDDDNKPLTRGDLKKFQQESAAKSALQLADEISSESERELTKYHLQNTIKSTGNPSEDLRLARSLVNAVKNNRIIEESNRKTEVKTYSNGSGAPAKDEAIRGELTPQEMAFLGKPFNMTKEQIIKARK